MGNRNRCVAKVDGKPCGLPVNGHGYCPSHYIVPASGSRQCRKCVTINSRERYRRKKNGPVRPWKRKDQS